MFGGPNTPLPLDTDEPYDVVGVILTENVLINDQDAAEEHQLKAVASISMSSMPDVGTKAQVKNDSNVISGDNPKPRDIRLLASTTEHFRSGQSVIS